MSAVLIFIYDCGYEVSIPVSHAERRELAEILEDVADQRHERECVNCERPTIPRSVQPRSDSDSSIP